MLEIPVSALHIKHNKVIDIIMKYMTYISLRT
jgi:hypothetical protein